MSPNTPQIGINGLGRIGRLAVRKLAKQSPTPLIAVNDPADLQTVVHLLRFDSVHVHNQLSIEGFHENGQDYLLIENRRIALYHHLDPSLIPWSEHGIQLVIEASGRFTRKAQAAAHLRGSVQRVLISAPSVDADETWILPIQPEKITEASGKHIISNASCTAHATAPMLWVLEQTFDIEAATMSTVHVATNDQRLLDAPHADLRRARAAMVGIHPTTSSAFQTLKQALPWVKSDFDGWALRVPTLSVNLVDITVKIIGNTTREAIHAAYQTAAAGPLKGILGIAEAPLVSCDFTGRTESVVMDLELTRLVGGNFFKVFGWHDNEVAYAERLCETALAWEKMKE